MHKEPELAVDLVLRKFAQGTLPAGRDLVLRLNDNYAVGLSTSWKAPSQMTYFRKTAACGTAGSAGFDHARKSLASSPCVELLQDVFDVFSNRMRRHDKHLRDLPRRLSAPNPAQNLELAWSQQSSDIPSPASVCAPDHPDQRRSQELEQRAVALTEVTLAALQIHRPRTSRRCRKPNTEAVVDPERLPHAVVEVEFPHPPARKAVGEL